MMSDLVESIQFKLKSAKYHHDRCFEVLTRPILFDNHDEQIVAISSELTAMMLTFQSMFDLLAQLINSKRNLKLNPKTLYFSKLHLQSPEIEDLKETIYYLQKHSRYLFAYCNTVKHRNLVKVSDEWTFISPGMSIQQFYVDSFERNGIKYERKHVNSILHEIFSYMSEKIAQILSQV